MECAGCFFLYEISDMNNNINVLSSEPHGKS